MLQSLATGTQEKGDAAVVTCSGKRRGGGSHSQWAGTLEKGEVAAVIRSRRAREGREVRWRQSFQVGRHRERGGEARSEAYTVGGGERRGPGRHETK